MGNLDSIMQLARLLASSDKPRSMSLFLKRKKLNVILLQLRHSDFYEATLIFLLHVVVLLTASSLFSSIGESDSLCVCMFGGAPTERHMNTWEPRAVITACPVQPCEASEAQLALLLFV